ncbi:FHA domain-containing protein [uncultured Tessaracoccus sp.]|uniref:FHA domain-containing protein n=1 Tax=uncultured Tessaracoccus sp. TaxID=905023 RepID=UPI0026165413|nr:FHA domain-containing protein [uncultured Tessaracoccus sp.]
MALPVAAWRLAYTSGKWLALSGPTSLVIMPAPPAEMSEFATNLWRGTLETRTPDALFEFVHEVGIGSLADFAAFFWDKAGLHGLFRGAAQLLNVDGELVAEGKDAVTWHEELLDQDQTYTIQLAPIEGNQVRLPLVVGAALVSSVTLTTAKNQLIRLPDAESMGVLEKIPVLGVRRRKRPIEKPAPAAPAPEATPSPAVPTPAVAEPASSTVDTTSLDADTQVPPQPPSPQPAAAPSIAAAAAGVPSQELDAEPEQPAEPSEPDPDDQPWQQPVVSLIGDSSAEPAPPTSSEQLEESELSEQPQHSRAQEQFDEPASPPPLSRPSAPPPMSAPSAPQSQVSPPGSRQAPVVVSGNFGEVDDEPGTVFSTDLAATHKPPIAQPTPDPQVMAVPCRNGHANPRGASSCRLCSEPVDPSNPRLIRRPVLAAVISNQGDGADLVSGVVVGRSPDGARGPRGSYLMRVSSSGNDISRNHILITPNEWNIVLTDLHSTNGTLVRPPGEPEFELRDGRSVTVEIGTELLLDDQVRLKIVPPRSD